MADSYNVSKMHRFIRYIYAVIIVFLMINITACGAKDTSGNTDNEGDTAKSQTTTDNQALNEAFKAIDMIVSNDVENGFTSAQVAVMKDGELVYSGAWGKVNSYDADGNRTAAYSDVTTDTLYDLASNTKMYSVAYAIQYLVTKGQLSLDSKIVDIMGSEFADNTILPEGYSSTAENLDKMKEWKRNVTIRDVMCHRAGFEASIGYEYKYYDYAKSTTDTDKLNPLFSGYDGSAATRELTLEKIFETPLKYEPRTSVLYSDTDYMLLCFLVEKVTGMRMDDFLNETFFKPLGLSHITYNPLQNGFTAADCAATEIKGNSRDGYLSYEGIRTDLIQGTVHDEKAYAAMAGVSGHAGLFSSAEDLAKLAYLMIDGSSNGVEYFSEEVLNIATSYDDVNHQDWGLGWWREGDMDMQRSKYFSNLSSESTIGHQGWTGTLTMIDRENKLVVVVLTNKINSHITSAANTNKFDGNWYTTAMLGFAPKLVYAALKGNDENAWVNVERAMEELDEISYYQKLAVDGAAATHPATLAYNSMDKSFKEFKAAI